ncbi:hypothetical protein [Myxococcus sp. RHSTA-1-4]|uniref:hypothetical protein n=1 Tax=Myxococcus sp. RHSTA-1-4 TaxID=2874601 RepID=UPI001CBB18AA|nr:hypothetical protein [Myxococcus sp. RHSTA-1-4]MBZ4417235.1 hypothetical protein [Myxococcus sp. RHSTA-1-4]
MSKISKTSSPQPPPAPREVKSSPAPEKKNVAAPAGNPVRGSGSTDGFDAPKKAGARQQVALETPAPAASARKPLSAGNARAVAQTSGPGEDGKLTVRVDTGTTTTVFPLGLQARNYIEIRVKPLDLGIAPENLQSELDRAMAEKLADDTHTYGAAMREAGYSSLEEWSKAKGYYGSPSHVAWAEAASARTGGQIPAEWWMKFDPFGGTAGNGPNILPTGEYPGVASRIAMAHDTDWDLGRYFGVGPLSDLRGAPNPEDLGPLGLDPRLGGDLYTFGHPDWEVTYGSEILPPGTPPPQVA